MYKRTFTLGGPSSPTIYVCPDGKVALFKSIHISNTSASTIQVSVYIEANGVGSVYIIKNGAIPKGAALNALDTTLVLSAGDVLKIHTPGAEGDAHVITSFMEVINE